MAFCANCWSCCSPALPCLCAICSSCCAEMLIVAVLPPDVPAAAPPIVEMRACFEDGDEVEATVTVALLEVLVEVGTEAGEEAAGVPRDCGVIPWSVVAPVLCRV